MIFHLSVNLIACSPPSRRPTAELHRDRCSANRDSDTTADRSRINEYRAVAEVRGSGETVESVQALAQRLDDRLDPAQQSIDRDAHSLAGVPGQEQLLARRGSPPLAPKRFRRETVGTSSPRTETQGRSRKCEAHPIERDALLDLGQRDDVSAARRLDQQAVDQGQGQRQPEDERGPLARVCSRPPRCRGRRGRHRGTTSRPTPRPESSLTVSRVENPGSKIKLTTRGSSAGVPVGTMPGDPLADDLLAVEPAAVVLDPNRHPVSLVAGERVIRPVALALCRPAGLERVVDGVADQVDHRVASRSTIVRSSRVSWPMIRSSISLPERSARSRTTRGNRENSSSTGTIRRSSVVSRICRLTRSSASRAWTQALDAGELAQALEVVGDDHQLAGQPDQVVELSGVDPDRRVQPR